MRCVLNAVGFQLGMEPLLSYRPSPLFNIVDKSILSHIIETLTQKGIKKFDIVLHHLPYMIEERLKEGQRWGVSITYHLAKDFRLPFSPLKAISRKWDDSFFLLGQGDELPDFSQVHFDRECKQDPLLFMYDDVRWSGWGIFPPDIFSTIPADATIEQFPQLLQKKERCRVTPFLSVQTFYKLQKSNDCFISAPHHGHMFPSTSHMVEPGVWISRGVVIHPSVKIIPPVFIGENCQIKENVRIGPHVVIERNCIIDAHSKIDNSLVCRRSFVGERLEIHHSIVDRNLLINLALDSHIIIKDDFILSELNYTPISQYVLNFVERFLGLLIFCLFLPIYFYMHFSQKVKTQEVLELPAVEDPQLWSLISWKTFEPYPGEKQTCIQKTFTNLPQLFNIMRGEAHFIGLSPRTPQVVEQMARDWKRLYIRSKIGLITLADLENGTSMTTDERYTSEVFYTVNMGFWYDVKLFFRWFIQKVTFYSKEQPHA